MSEITDISITLPMKPDEMMAAMSKLRARLSELDEQRRQYFALIEAIRGFCKHDGDPCTICGKSWD